MKSHIYSFFKMLGIDLKKLFYSLKGIRFYFRDYSKLKKQKGSDNTFPFGRRYPILSDRFDSSGVMDGHYFHQDLYVAKKIYKANPVRHIDIGSRTDGFVAHVAVFREIEIIDIRDQKSKVPNIKFMQADLMQLPNDLVDSCDSISTLHAIEHFGLGRYGDPIDYMGYLKALENIKKMLKSGGKFYFSTPIGPQRIEFNAHRVFSVKYLLELFKDDYQLNSFSFVDDRGDMHENVELDTAKVENNFGCTYGCGIFELTKK